MDRARRRHQPDRRREPARRPRHAGADGSRVACAFAGGLSTEPQAATLPRTPREQEFYDHLCTLPFGTWIEFPVNERGEVVRRRLAWYSPRTGHALFVNQRGQRIEDGSAPQNLDPVARLFAAGTAHVVTADRGGLVDRAWQATLSMLRGLGPGRPGIGEVR